MSNLNRDIPVWTTWDLNKSLLVVVVLTATICFLISFLVGMTLFGFTPIERLCHAVEDVYKVNVVAIGQACYIQVDKGLVPVSTFINLP